MVKPVISIIIPVYNAEKRLSICIDSVLQQTFSDLELILIDDGSADRSGEICDAYAQADARVQVVHQTNAGVSTARNRGLDLAKGTYIMFVDSDDEIDSKFLECAYQDITKEKADLHVSGLVMEQFVNREKVDETVYRANGAKSYSQKTLLEGMNVEYPQICICGPCCKLYHKKLLQGVRFEPELKFGEDTLFNLGAISNAEKIYMSDQVFYHYFRGDGDSLFSRFHPETYEVHTLVYDKMRTMFREQGCNPEAKARFEKLYFTMLVGGIIEYFQHGDKTTRQERRQQIEKVEKNEYVCKLSPSKMTGLKQKVILLLLKKEMTGVLEKLFVMFYMS